MPTGVWSETESVLVQKLPHNIDGTKVYIQNFDPNDRMKSSRDDRPWNKYYNSKRKHFDGIRRLATCKEGFRWDRLSCSFRIEHGHQFIGSYCKYCNMPAEIVICHARKVWEFDDESGTVTIYHHGNHSCSVKPERHHDLQRKIIDQFKENTKLLPCQVASQNIIKAIQDDKWEEIDQMSQQLTDINIPRT